MTGPAQAGLVVLQVTRGISQNRKRSERQSTMVAKDTGNRLQDAFVGAVKGAPTTLYMVNGVRLQGAIVATDRHTLLLVREGTSQLVYKHAVSTVMPADSVDLTSPDDDSPPV